MTVERGQPRQLTPAQSQASRQGCKGCLTTAAAGQVVTSCETCQALHNCIKVTSVCQGRRRPQQGFDEGLQRSHPQPHTSQYTHNHHSAPVPVLNVPVLRWWPSARPGRRCTTSGPLPRPRMASSCPGATWAWICCQRRSPWCRRPCVQPATPWASRCC